jgi:hypothetical protein
VRAGWRRLAGGCQFLSSPLPIGHRKAAKLNQPRFLRVNLQPKLLHPGFQDFQKTLRILPVLEPQDKVISVPNDDDLAFRFLLPPSLHP